MKPICSLCKVEEINENCEVGMFVDNIQRGSGYLCLTCYNRMFKNG